MAQTINGDNGVISGSTGLKFSADTTGILALQTNGTTALTVDASGIVHVGTTVSSISSQGNRLALVIKGKGTAASDGIGVLALTTNTANATATNVGNIEWHMTDNSSSSGTRVGYIAMFASGSTANNRGSLMDFATKPDGVSGTGTSAMTIDANGNLKLSFYFYSSSNTAVTAAGSTQGTATALTVQLSHVTTVALNTGVILPTPIAAGLRITVRNGGANALNVYPHSGGNIAGTGTNVAISVDVGTVLDFISFDTTNWYIPSAVLA